MLALRRWIPLVAVLVLAVGAILRALGQFGLADAFEALATFLGPDKTLAIEVTAAVGAIIGVLLKLVSIFREIREGETHVTPRVGGAQG